MDKNILKGFDGERFVNELAINSYLSYWCYPNPKDEHGDKKEICDLLILFKSTLIIVCVKNYEFKGKYKRYFNKTIEKDLKQILGAERKLLRSNRNIVIKGQDNNREIINPDSIKDVFRIIVHLAQDVKFYPFCSQTKNNSFVNIFDAEAFYNIVTTLDTIKDVTEYLVKREETFKDKKVLILPGEENDFDTNTGKQFFEHTNDRNGKKEMILSGTESDLLAHYYTNNKQFFSEGDYTDLFFQLDGTWDSFMKQEKVKNKESADKISYFIDEYVINEIIPNPSAKNIEIAKELLSLSRFERRVVAKQFFDFVKRYNDTRGFYIAKRYGAIGDFTIAFAFYTLDMTQEQIDVMLSLVINGYIVHKNYELNKIIFIATTNDMAQFKFGVQGDIKPFSKDNEDAILHDLKLLKWFQNIEEISFTEHEFPDKL